MKRRVFSKTTPFHTFKKKKKKREGAERCRFERHCSSFFFPPKHCSGEEGKKGLLFEFFPVPLSPGAHRPNTLADHAPARKPGGAEPWQSRPMADQPAAPHEKKPCPWLYK
jgi:hypothetical protein